MQLPKLTRSLIESGHEFPPDVEIDREAVLADLPERVVQFGEGNFLRGFVDWMIDRLNAEGLFGGRVVVVQPIPTGMVNELNEQDGLYTLILRGLREGKVVEEKRIIGSISRGIDPYEDYEAYLASARNPDVRFVVSNTTEAGIACDPEDSPDDRPPRSFPAKLTAFLLERWSSLGDTDTGVVVLPCELIERNGDNLRRCVFETAEKWELDTAFRRWLDREVVFTNTLVDRIVTGYPRDEVEELTGQLGYRDDLLDTGEVFHAWVIEGPTSLAEELPLRKLGLNVVWTEDVTPYRDRKVKILNGAHTSTVLAAYLAGKETVKDCMDDPVIAGYLEGALREEIIPTLDLPREDLESFAAAVLERFSNPFVRHELLSISLNSTSKFKARVLPSIRDYLERRGELPARLTFALAALIAFYRGTEIRDGVLIGHREGEPYPIRDDAEVLQKFRQLWRAYDDHREPGQVARSVLADQALWGSDLTQLPRFAEAVTGHLVAILERGAEQAMREIGG